MRQSTIIIVSLLIGVASSFPTARHIRASETRLLGGYYSEPEANEETLTDDRPRHMLFGVKCVEGVLNVPGCKPIKYLEAIDDGNEARASITSFAETLSRHLDLSSIHSIVELGSSVVSLAAARLGASHVTACDASEDRLQILQHADCFVNSPSPSGAVKTVKLPTEFFLPYGTDLVIVTTDDVTLLVKCINEAMYRNIPMLIPEAYVQVPHILSLFPTGWRPTGGVFAADPSRRLSWK